LTTSAWRPRLHANYIAGWANGLTRSCLEDSTWISPAGPEAVHERAHGTRVIDADPAFRERWNAHHGGGLEWAVAVLELRPLRIFSFDGALE